MPRSRCPLRSLSCVLAVGLLSCQRNPAVDAPAHRADPSATLKPAPSGSAADDAVDTSGYLRPPQDVVKIVDAPPTPSVSVGPQGRWMMMATEESHPSIEVVAAPFERLAGIRIDPARGVRRQLQLITEIAFQDLQTGTRVEAQLPKGARIASTQWSPRGTHVVLALVTPAGHEPWLVTVATGEARRLTDRHLNDVLGESMRFLSGPDTLLLRLVPSGRGEAPPAPRAPRGPVVQDTSGKKAQNRTYQDLLTNAHDEALFTHYATSQLVTLDLATGTVTPVGEPGLLAETDPAPDGAHILVERLEPPFSYVVPWYRFGSVTEVWNRDGKSVFTLDRKPVQDQIPIEGVSKGPRRVHWQPQAPATLVYATALDEGDPNKPADFRDELFVLPAPFGARPESRIKLEHRYAGIDWTSRPGELLVTEYDRDRRWLTTHWIEADGSRHVLFDRSRHDRYGDPGRVVNTTLPDGRRVALVEDGGIFLDGAGATPEGDRPFLDRLVLADRTKTRLFEATAEVYAYFVDFVPRGKGERAMLIRRESPEDPPNYFLVEDGAQRAVTEFPDPHPQLTGIDKQLLTYTRGDGVDLSATLYLPPDHTDGDKLPLVVWAYPLEYTDKSTAGQVSQRPNRFTRLGGTSPLMFLTQGYAVLDNAAMPVVGDPKNMNDTFVRQISDAARAAIRAASATGQIDPNRVVVAGHSYGAFMTANLLAHTDLFRGGIARSGAYNRTLTPFGFQSERRTLWEGTDAYIAVSPLFHAHKINEPILMIHGEADNNSGTFPLQSRRLFHAISGLGGTARLVLLPHESHGYQARESILHTLHESFTFLDAVTGDPIKTPPSAPTPKSAP